MLCVTVGGSASQLDASDDLKCYLDKTAPLKSPGNFKLVEGFGCGGFNERNKGIHQKEARFQRGLDSM